MNWGRRLQYAAVCVTIVAYAGLSHFCNTTGTHNPGTRGLGAALALAPLCLFALALAWRRTLSAAMLLTAGLAAALYVVWPLLEKHFSMFYLVQETSVYSLLCLTFSRSLLRGKTPLCTQLADKVHGPLSPLELRYTRRVTLAWALFFFAIAATSLLLFVLAPLRIWSIYINFCVLPLVGAMFVGEFLMRRQVLPKIERAGLIATMRVYFASSQ